MRSRISWIAWPIAALMAAGVVSTLPVMLAFFATQRWLVKGLTAGAVKG